MRLPDAVSASSGGSGVEGGEEVPEGYAGADGDVEGVFCAELWYFIPT